MTSQSSPLVPDRRPIGRIVTLLCGAITAAGLGFAVQLVLSRTLDVPSYGRFVAMLAVANVLSPLASWGLGWMWLQVYGSEGWNAYRWISVSLRALGLSSSAAIVLMVSYLLVSEPTSSNNVIIVVMAMIVIMLSQSQVEIVSARLQLEERYGLLTVWQLFAPVGRALIILMLLEAGYRDRLSLLVGFALVATAASVFAIVSFENVRRGGLKLAGHGQAPPTPPRQPPPELRHVFTEALPYVMQTMFFLVGSQGIVAIIERLLGPRDAAIYNVAFLILSAVYLIPTVIYTKYLVGKIFRWWAQDRQMFNAAFHVGVAVLLGLGLLCMAIVMVAAPLLVSILFGSQYGDAVPVLMILAIAIPLRFVLHTYAAAFYSRQNMLRKVCCLGIAVAAGVALNLILTPHFGLNGAAIAAVAADFLLLLLYFRGASGHIEGLDVWSTFKPSTLRRSLAYIGRTREVH
jgi:O-antigen/teichoic acid export membrane protein